MRLTLRTLLAYLDDVLDPESTKEIGKKLSESEYASSLVDRIKQVTRQRRLMAPELEANKNHLDANTVAEYLDNIAAPEQIASIEKVCLDSDVELAEVAAVHQVLTLILGEPVDIPAETRERMYKIVPKGKIPAVVPTRNDLKGAPPKTSPNKDNAAPESSVMEVTKSSTEFRLPPKELEPAASSESDFKEELPDYLKSKSSGSLRNLVVIASVMLALFGGLLYLDADFRKTIQGFLSSDNGEQDSPLVAQNENENEKDSEVPDDSSETDATSDTKPTTEEETTEAPPFEEAETDTEVAVVTPKEMSVETLPEKPSEESDSTESAKKEPDPIPEKAPASTEEKPVIPPVPPEPGTETNEASPETEAPAQEEPKAPKIPPVAVQYVSNEGILLRQDQLENDWFTMPYRSIVQPEEFIASPFPFITSLKIDKGACHLAMWGGSTIEVLPPTEGAKLGLKVPQGQIVFSAHPYLEENNLLPYNIDLVLGGNLWRIALESADTRVGIQIQPKMPTRPQEDLSENSFDGLLYVAAGSVQFSDGAGQVLKIGANQSCSLTPAEVRSGLKLTNQVNDQGETLPIPEWLDPQNVRISPAVRNAKKKFESLFVADAKVTQTLSSAITDKNPITASWVVQCLGQTGDVRSLTRALTLPDQPLEVIHHSARYLKMALGTSAEAYEPLIISDLESSLPPEDIQILMRLLWGFDDKSAKKPDISSKIVEWLGHESLAIRELSFQYAQQFSGRNFSYRSQAKPDQIRSKQQRWRKYLDQNGGAFLK